MEEREYVHTQKATLPLDHGRIIYETNDSNIIRLEIGDSGNPEIKFVGEGVATYEIKMLYQPQPDYFPCLVSNPRFVMRVFWSEENEDFVATPFRSGDMNRSQRWLEEGVRVMNALHRYYEDTLSQDKNEVGDDCSDSDTLTRSRISSQFSNGAHTLASIAGAFVGAATKQFTTGP